MLRPELQIVANWIAPNTRVLDLGCGNGSLLKYLRDTKHVEGYGLEINHNNIVNCLNEGIAVIQSDLDEEYLSQYFENESFDYVIMTETLQAMRYPDILLDEVSRIGKQAIITFPNMGYWLNRWQFLKGKMPITKELPKKWYNTDNIHLCTIDDFEALCKEKNIALLERIVVDSNHKQALGSRLLPNLLGEIALYRLQRGQ